jgi:uncharacterized protein
MPALLHRPEVWLFTFTLCLLYPLADFLLYSRLKTAMQIYIWNILAAWFLCAAAAYLIYHYNLTLSDFGQNFGTYPRTLIVSVILLALIVTVVAVNKLQKSKPSPEKISKLTDSVRKLLPATRNDRIVWVLVSITAGFCEEFLFRGWLLNLTGKALHSVLAGLLISSLFFGFAHLYQGRSGVIGTGILGLFFGLVYIASGSLLPSQILHTLLDLVNGLRFAKRSASQATAKA